MDQATACALAPRVGDGAALFSCTGLGLLCANAASTLLPKRSHGCIRASVMGLGWIGLLIVRVHLGEPFLQPLGSTEGAQEGEKLPKPQQPATGPMVVHVERMAEMCSELCAENSALRRECQVILQKVEREKAVVEQYEAAAERRQPPPPLEHER